MMTVSTTKEKINDYLIVTGAVVSSLLLASVLAMFHKPSQSLAYNSGSISLGLLTALGGAVVINELRD